MPVLQHQEGRPLAGNTGEQIGDGGVQPVAFGVGIGAHRRWQLPDPQGQVGEQPRQLSARRTHASRSAAGSITRAR